MSDIFLIAPLRTPIGKFGGALASMTAPDLGVASATATLARSGIDPSAVDEVIFGNARQAGVGPNSAYLLPRARWGAKMEHQELVDGMVRDGFMCPLAD